MPDNGVTYPGYGIDITPELVEQCCDTATRLLDEVGFEVAHEGFLDAVRGKPGLRIDGDRVFFDPCLTREYLGQFTAGKLSERPAGTQPPPTDEWTAQIAGYSMSVLDVETDEIRSATCQDLRDLIRLANSCGVGGSYPCMPQDIPPLMRAIACFKICWEESESIRPYDYQQPEQTRYIYDMHRAMGYRFDITLTVPSALSVDPKDLGVLLDFYPEWKSNRDIDVCILDYGMIGITKPMSAVGCAAMTLTETLALHVLLNLFDSDMHVPVVMIAGTPTDLRHACWAFGSPRRHLLRYLDSRLGPRLCGIDPGDYAASGVLLETGSAAVDEQAAMEKMAVGLLGAMQGARTFGYAGTLCVDDLFSAVQFIIDLEMVEYIRETIQAFDPHPDVIDATGLYEECREVGLGEDTFISHPNTIRRLRNVMPSSQRLVREKLSTWLHHCTSLADRARAEALERIAAQEPHHLDDEKQRALDAIYARAEAEFGA